LEEEEEEEKEDEGEPRAASPRQTAAAQDGFMVSEFLGYLYTFLSDSCPERAFNCGFEKSVLAARALSHRHQ
jgi:hypothetical protein